MVVAVRAAGAGLVIVTGDGGALSTVTLRNALERSRPTASRTRTWSTWGPLATDVVSQLSDCDTLAEAAKSDGAVLEPTSTPSTYHSISLTPVSSVAETAMVVVDATMPPDAGELNVGTAGARRSTVIVRCGVVWELPSASVTCTDI